MHFVSLFVHLHAPHHPPSNVSFDCILVDIVFFVVCQLSDYGCFDPLPHRCSSSPSLCLSVSVCLSLCLCLSVCFIFVRCVQNACLSDSFLSSDIVCLFVILTKARSAGNVHTVVKAVHSYLLCVCLDISCCCFPFILPKSVYGF